MKYFLKKIFVETKIEPIALKWDKSASISLVFVVMLTMLLSGIGAGWGKSGLVPWAPDAIEGITAVREMDKLFGRWEYKYPRLQFLIDGMMYKPFIRYWEKNPEYVVYGGQKQASVLTQQRLSTLATISRTNVFLMSLGTVILTFLIARYYFGDHLSGFFAALALSCSLMFVIYSHFSNVDIPSVFWLTFGVYWMLRSVFEQKSYQKILMALGFVFSACTKDAMISFVASFVIVYLIMSIRRSAKDNTGGVKKILRDVFCGSNIAAAIVFLFLFALLQNILTAPSAYFERMGIWAGGRGVEDFNKDFTNHAALALKSFMQIVAGFGWPMLAFVVCSIIYAIRKHTISAFIFVFPLLFFYVSIVMNIRMSYPRYYLPVFVFICILAGKAASELTRNRSVKPFLRTVILLFVFGSSFIYCLGFDLEFASDSRYRLEQWFVKNVDKKSPVVSLIKRPYCPQLEKYGFQYITNWQAPSLDKYELTPGAFPDYVVTVSSDWIVRKENHAFKDSLYSLNAPYKRVAKFKELNFNSERLTFWNWPGYMTPDIILISPNVSVFKKDQPKWI